MPRFMKGHHACNAWSFIHQLQDGCCVLPKNVCRPQTIVSHRQVFPESVELWQITIASLIIFRQDAITELFQDCHWGRELSPIKQAKYQMQREIERVTLNITSGRCICGVGYISSRTSRLLFFLM